jgi:hypothetical protein
MGEMSETVIVMIKEESSLYIFYERKRKDTNDKSTNTDRNLVPIVVNQVVLYRDLQQLQQSYGIDAQDFYFFVEEKLPPGTVIY